MAIAFAMDKKIDLLSQVNFLVEVTGCECPVDTSVQRTEAPTEATAEISTVCFAYYSLVDPNSSNFGTRLHALG